LFQSKQPEFWKNLCSRAVDKKGKILLLDLSTTWKRDCMTAFSNASNLAFILPKLHQYAFVVFLMVKMKDIEGNETFTKERLLGFQKYLVNALATNISKFQLIFHYIAHDRLDLDVSKLDVQSFKAFFKTCCEADGDLLKCKTPLSHLARVNYYSSFSFI
jgi:hypothetical protein